MRSKLQAGVALAACGALALAGPAAAGGGAETTVTIKAESGGFFGYVKSPKPNRCANDRKVTLFKEKGDPDDRSDDRKINSDTASPNGDRYMWSTGNTGTKGKHYARAGKIDGCQADRSKTIRAQN